MRKVILRTCAYLRELKNRQTMFRVVKTPNHEIHIDLTYALQGRGAYLSKDKDIILKAKKRHTLEKSLKVIDCQNIYDQLIDLLK
jgi:predicted RNA-binding protein YlxR (DUF448 family)